MSNNRKLQMNLVLPSIVGVLVVCATVLLAIFYARKDTPYYAYATTFIGWLFGFIMVAILPLDVYIVRSPLGAYSPHVVVAFIERGRRVA